MNIAVLQPVLPRPVFLELPQALEIAKITTPIQLAHFLGQCHHESSGFLRVVENLNYSVEGLMKTFPKYFKDPYRAQAVVGRPEEIANIVYALRMGNGYPPSGDGYRYRGRGYIQLTGKSNYRAFDVCVPENIVEYPDLVATKYPLTSAAHFWLGRKVNIAAVDLSDACITKVTKVINGGLHGLPDRIKQTRHYHRILDSA